MVLLMDLTLLFMWSKRQLTFMVLVSSSFANVLWVVETDLRPISARSSTSIFVGFILHTFLSVSGTT